MRKFVRVCVCASVCARALSRNLRLRSFFFVLVRTQGFSSILIEFARVWTMRTTPVLMCIDIRSIWVACMSIYYIMRPFRAFMHNSRVFREIRVIREYTYLRYRFENKFSTDFSNKIRNQYAY